MKRLLALLLHIANTSPPLIKGNKEGFYRIKDRLLKRWGIHLAYDIQHIQKLCFRCDGTGDDAWSEDVECRKCGGTGIYDEFWVILEKWKFGKYTFHSPWKRYTRDDLKRAGLEVPDVRMIEGYIQHESYPYHLAMECFYWLALIFDWGLFMDSIGRIGFTSGKRTPMVLLNNAIFKIRMFPREAKEKIRLIRLKWKVRHSEESEEVPF